jgi:hypothetical protein
VIPTKLCRGLAFAAFFSLLIPPMMLITVLSFSGAFGHGISHISEYSSYWPPVVALGFALLTIFWTPASNRARIAITILNTLILSSCLIADLALLLGMAHVHF